jgi:hypothetical protein
MKTDKAKIILTKGKEKQEFKDFIFLGITQTENGFDIQGINSLDKVPNWLILEIVKRVNLSIISLIDALRENIT